MADVLVIGAGGREHALAWKLEQSPSVDKVYVAPGNGGSQGKISNVDIAFDDPDGLLKFAQDNKIGLTVVGQEAASEAGVVDAFEMAGLTIFGPNQAAAQIETSKTFSKDLMAAANIPTAAFKNFSDDQAARDYAKSRPLPVVIKADGLATGKGVFICQTVQEVDDALDQIMVKKIFGESGGKVVVEDFLRGQEASIHALCDGKNTVLFPPSQDHKQVFDGDKGPNTGGMGAFTPFDQITEVHLQFVKQKVIEPALATLQKHDAEFRGCLYPGLMIDGNEVKILEFNARFGDPEAEIYVRLLDSDLYNLLKACAEGQLTPDLVKWKTDYAITVVLVSDGYPGSYPKGLPITGIEAAEAMPDIVVFHAGTKREGDQVLTAGGRVLNVTALGKTLEAARDKAYAAVRKIHFDGVQYRTDIGRRPGLT